MMIHRSREIAIWNPWLRQTRWIEAPKRFYDFFGLGYVPSRPESGYKILAFRYDGYLDDVLPESKIYEFTSNTWRDFEYGLLDWEFGELASIHSFNGTLYWIAGSRVNNSREYFIQSFDFSEEKCKPFCCFLPCKNGFGYIQVLAFFRGDRFSLLEQCSATNMIEIWVTKNKINGTEEEEEEAVSWRLLMKVSIPNFPRFQPGVVDSRPSYFIDNNDDKRLILCICDEYGQACIYIVRGDALKKLQIDSVDLWPFGLVISLMSLVWFLFLQMKRRTRISW